MDSQKKQLGQELRRKFLDAIPGLEPLIDAVKERVRVSGRLRALDGVLFSVAQNMPASITCFSQPVQLFQSAGVLSDKTCSMELA